MNNDNGKLLCAKCNTPLEKDMPCKVCDEHSNIKKEEVKFPVTLIEIKQLETGELRLFTKLIPPMLVYNMVLMLFSVVNNLLNPKKNIIQLPKNGFRQNLGKFLKGK